MPLVTISDLSIGFRGPPLLDSVSCTINRGERVGLLGRNGAGKTTLLKMIAGIVEPDAGQIVMESGRHAALLQQDVPRELDRSIAEVVADGQTPRQIAAGNQADPVQRILSLMELEADGRFARLSSGMKRRVLLARALVSDPDLLLLDEPTNHLDIAAIEWLEKFLLKFGAALVFVTHDRMFLRRMASRILEIDRGRLFDWTCDYDTFLKRKATALAAEEKENALFDKRLAEEEVWIRQGIKARRTRNEGRVRELEKMRRERRDRREKTGTVNLQISSGSRSGQLVAELKNISFGYGDDGPGLIRDFSTTVMRGDKVGIIGPNGVGKTTLLKILLGRLQPQSGSVQHGTNLQIAWFDQLREQLNEEQTIEENVGEGSDAIVINGSRKHIYGYLQDFLFTPERARTPIRFLSGGERNRILLAKLFSKPANLIVLDEPTNDLDTETLELLEQRLVSFDGTVLLVSHDRAFLNNVVGSSIVFENGGVREYFGGYDDWLRQREPPPARNAKARADKPKREKPKSGAERKLKYAERQELESLPERIETVESEIHDLHTAMADPAFYRQAPDVLAAEQTRLKSLESALQAAYERWAELEQRSAL